MMQTLCSTHPFRPVNRVWSRPVPMLAFLGQALAEARESAGVALGDIAYEGRSQGRGAKGAGFDVSKLSRLERGQHRRWPADIDDIILTYAESTGTTPLWIWNRALQLQGLSEGRRATRRASRGRRATD